MDLFGIRILLQSVFLVTIVFLFLSYGGLNGHCPRVRAHRHQFGLRYDLGTPMKMGGFEVDHSFHCAVAGVEPEDRVHWLHHKTGTKTHIVTKNAICAQ